MSCKNSRERVAEFCRDLRVADTIYQMDNGDTQTVVYSLADDRTQKSFAAKYVYMQRRPRQEDRLREELENMKKLPDSKNIMRLIDYSYRIDSGGIELILLMENCTSLQDRMMLEGGIDSREALKISMDLLEGLSVCHRAGLAHRDIKPENVFMDRDGNYLLGDFGISSLLRRNGDISDDANRQMCTSYYAAPEVLEQKKHIDWLRADVYSLSIVLYLLFNENRMPWGTCGQKEMLERRCRDEKIPLPAAPVSMLPAACVICKGLSRSPSKRYASASEMLTDLKRAVETDTCKAFEEYHRRTFARSVPVWQKALLIFCAVLCLAAVSAGILRLALKHEETYQEKYAANRISDFALTYIPGIGSRNAFEGKTFIPDGEYANYRVTLYLRVDGNDNFYVKPTNDHPYAEIAEDGTFSIDYVSGENDENAVEIYVFLIEKEFIPTGNIERTKAAALNFARVLRNADGSMELVDGAETR